MTPAALPGKAKPGVNQSNTRPGLPPSENHTISVFTGRELTAILSAHLSRQGGMPPTQASNSAAKVAGEAPGKFPSDNRMALPSATVSAQSNVSKTQERYKSGVADKT